MKAPEVHRRRCRGRAPRSGGPGQGLIEYALIACMVAVVVVAVLLTMGPQVGSVFSSASLGGAGGLFADCKPLPPGQSQGQGQQQSKAGWCPPGTG